MKDVKFEQGDVHRQDALFDKLHKKQKKKKIPKNDERGAR